MTTQQVIIVVALAKKAQAEELIRKIAGDRTFAFVAPLSPVNNPADTPTHYWAGYNVVEQVFDDLLDSAALSKLCRIHEGDMTTPGEVLLNAGLTPHSPDFVPSTSDFGIADSHEDDSLHF